MAGEILNSNLRLNELISLLQRRDGNLRRLFARHFSA